MPSATWSAGAMLAHVASAQGKVAVENLLGMEKTINYDVIPARFLRYLRSDESD
ncbi:MAG: hypothetical protein U0361_22650 [Nitrospiraceae bacterium]